MLDRRKKTRKKSEQKQIGTFGTSPRFQDTFTTRTGLQGRVLKGRSNSADDIRQTRKTSVTKRELNSRVSSNIPNDSGSSSSQNRSLRKSSDSSRGEVKKLTATEVKKNFVKDSGEAAFKDSGSHNFKEGVNNRSGKIYDLQPKGEGIKWWANAAAGLEKQYNTMLINKEIGQVNVNVAGGTVPIAMQGDLQKGADFIVTATGQELIVETKKGGTPSEQDVINKFKEKNPALALTDDEIKQEIKKYEDWKSNWSGLGKRARKIYKENNPFSDLNIPLTNDQMDQVISFKTNNKPDESKLTNDPSIGDDVKVSYPAFSGRIDDLKAKFGLVDADIAKIMLEMVKNPNIPMNEYKLEGIDGLGDSQLQKTLRELMVTWMVAEPARYSAVVFDSVKILEKISTNKDGFSFKDALKDNGLHPMTGKGTAAEGRAANQALENDKETPDNSVTTRRKDLYQDESQEIGDMIKKYS